jgi:ubiquinol-cytochrome c reductase iron-sulfur subunit
MLCSNANNTHIPDASSTDRDERTRRDFLLVSTTAAGLAGMGLASWPFIDSMNPAADVRILANVEFDLAPIEVGQRITIIWQGRPVFVDHRTEAEIYRAKADDTADLRDPQPDSARVQLDDWLIVVGVCTHLGCIPLGQTPGTQRGDFGGWFCPCHGSHYDTSGRIRKGPAPRNLDVPPYRFASNEIVQIG